MTLYKFTRILFSLKSSIALQWTQFRRTNETWIDIALKLYIYRGLINQKVKILGRIFVNLTNFIAPFYDTEHSSNWRWACFWWKLERFFFSRISPSKNLLVSNTWWKYPYKYLSLSCKKMILFWNVHITKKSNFSLTDSKNSLLLVEKSSVVRWTKNYGSCTLGRS